MRLCWHKPSVIIGIAICLLLLMLQPMAGVALATALVLTPVLLFGLVAVPRSLWPVAEFSPAGAAAVFVGPQRLQRPPPISIP